MPPLFRRLGRRKRIARIDTRIAKNRGDVAVILPVAGLGQNLDAAAARARVFGRERVLVDPDLLHRRCADVQRVHFHPVDDDRHAAVAERAGIQESRHGRDQIVVKHRQALQQAGVDRDGINVTRRCGPDIRRVAHGDFLLQRGDAEHELLPRRAAPADADASDQRREAFELRSDLVLPRGYVVEPECAHAVSRSRGQGDARRVQQFHSGAGEHRAGLILCKHR